MSKFLFAILSSCVLVSYAVPITTTEDHNLAGTLQLKITGTFDSKADSHSGLESSLKPVKTGFDDSDLEESEDRNSSKLSSILVGQSSMQSMKLKESNGNRQLSEANKLEGKNLSGNENVKEMIMSVMGIEEERKRKTDPRSLHQESLQSESAYQKSLHDEALVQKLMEGSMVITASEDHKDQESKNISVPTPTPEDAKHFSRNVTQPLNLVINFYTSNREKVENDAAKNGANLQGGVYPELKSPKREFRVSKCHFNGSIYDNGETIKTSHPCDHCICRHGHVSCFWQQCDGAPGFQCVPLFTPGSCCPVYSCAKEKKG